ncbi:MAG TPA: shikimate dehydrogenase [Anaerolineae bacterium]|nr:shikimate dehydrogenase [Anaerolineae bacterium]
MKSESLPNADVLQGTDCRLQPILSGHTQIVGVIGWPIEHSVSPPMHNAAFEALGMDWCYLPFPVHPANLKEAMAGVRALGLRGINVTVPHKKGVVALVDELTPAADAVGAVNTVISRGEVLVGHNTDVDGFLRALRETGFEPEGCSALILGAGGAARAVVYALAGVGAQLVILNRTLGRAQALAAAFAGVSDAAHLRAGPLDEKSLRLEMARANLVVNATSLGMWPQVGTTPWPDDLPFPSHALLFDLVYNPRETCLMRRALSDGARAVGGLRMLVHQGAEAFALWTGREPPVETMFAACRAALRGGE